MFQKAKSKHKHNIKKNIRPADLVQMESLSSKNKNAKYLLCIIQDFAKYAWVKPLKVKKRRVKQFLRLLSKQ